MILARGLAVRQLKIVVVGNGMVGHHFVEQIMNDARYDITVIGAEPRPV